MTLNPQCYIYALAVKVSAATSAILWEDGTLVS